MEDLTGRQREVLGVIAGFEYPPTLREVAEKLGAVSASGVKAIVDILAAKGYLERLPKTSRGFRVVKFWYQIPECVLALGKWLISENRIDDASAMLEFFRNPKAMQREWGEFCSSDVRAVSRLARRVRWR